MKTIIAGVKLSQEVGGHQYLLNSSNKNHGFNQTVVSNAFTPKLSTSTATGNDGGQTRIDKTVNSKKRDLGPFSPGVTRGGATPGNVSHRGEKANTPGGNFTAKRSLLKKGSSDNIPGASSKNQQSKTSLASSNHDRPSSKQALGGGVISRPPGIQTSGVVTQIRKQGSIALLDRDKSLHTPLSGAAGKNQTKNSAHFNLTTEAEKKRRNRTMRNNLLLNNAGSDTGNNADNNNIAAAGRRRNTVETPSSDMQRAMVPFELFKGLPPA